MKLCITAQGETLDSPMEERFGRAPYFIFVDSATGSFEAIRNPFAEGGGGVGPKAAQLLIARSVNAVITGQVGGNAQEALSAAGIAVHLIRTGGTVRDAVEQFGRKGA
jgi:predicted Fe-Mo cluster-binding NifX family protein